MALSSSVESSGSLDTVADEASVPGTVSSPTKEAIKEDEAALLPPSQPAESSGEMPAAEIVEPEPQSSPAPEEPMDIPEDLPEDSSPGELQTKTESKDEEMEEEEDQVVSSAEAESMVETVASEEMVVETVIEDSLSSGINLDEDKESVQSDSEQGTGADEEPKPESVSGKEGLEMLSEQVSSEPESKIKDDLEEQLAADESDSIKDAAKSEGNDEEMPLESPDVPDKKDKEKEDVTQDDTIQEHQPAADEDDAEESKDSSAPETVSSPSPAGETLSNLDEPQSEDMDDEKLKDDKSSIEDVKTPETPCEMELDMKDDGSQHAESGTEDGAGELSKHLLGSVGDSVPNSPASLLQGEDSEVVRDYKVWKKSIMLVWRAAANHKYANVFLHPVTDEMAPGYHSIVYRPMDLLTIKKNIENGYIKTTLEFQRDMMLMFQNAIMYNSSDHDVFHMAIEMQKEVMGHIQDFLATQLMVKTTETKSLRGRDGRDKKPDTGREEKVSGPPHAALLAGPAHS